MVLIFKGCSSNKHSIGAVKSISNQHSGQFDYIIVKSYFLKMNKTFNAAEDQKLVSEIPLVLQSLVNNVSVLTTKWPQEVMEPQRLRDH